MDAILTYVRDEDNGEGVEVSDVLQNATIESRSTVNGKSKLVKTDLSTFDEPSVELIIDRCVKAGYLDRQGSILFFKEGSSRMKPLPKGDSGNVTPWRL